MRVLAIDQAPKEKDGENTVLGKTVTLELRPEQAETLARARQSGTVSLALRSLVDAEIIDVDTESRNSTRGSSIDIVRHGIATSQATQK